VHVVTRSPDTNRVDFEEGVWMHRLAPAERHVPELAGVPLARNPFHPARGYHQGCPLHRAAPGGQGSAPPGAHEGLLCILDERFATVQTLMTSLRTVAGLHPSWDGQEWLGQALALERAAARRARYLHPISAAILEKVRADYAGADGEAAVLP